MTRTQYIIVGVIVATALGGWLWLHRDYELLHTDLMELYDDAEKRSSMDLELAFNLRTTTIGGETRRTIFMHPDSSMTFEHVMIPEHASFRAWIALMPEVWDKDGDGVVFRFGVSDGRAYDPLVTRVVNPMHVTQDRQWIAVTVDLSDYAGERVDLILNTNGSPSGQPLNLAYDWAVWAEPAILVSR
jgi:hypothetical protein